MQGGCYTRTSFIKGEGTRERHCAASSRTGPLLGRHLGPGASASSPRRGGGGRAPSPSSEEGAQDPPSDIPQPEHRRRSSTGTAGRSAGARRQKDGRGAARRRGKAPNRERTGLARAAGVWRALTTSGRKRGAVRDYFEIPGGRGAKGVAGPMHRSGRGGARPRTPFAGGGRRWRFLMEFRTMNGLFG